MLGVFLPNNRTQPRTPEHEEYFAGTRPGNERDELFRDIGMGCGAHYTEKPVPAANITDTLLENLSEDRQTPIFDAIRTHMRHPLSDAELRQLHTVLRNQRRLSVQREGTAKKTNWIWTMIVVKVRFRECQGDGVVDITHARV
ncbi:hypothetical protein [Desulfosporosinus sp. BG]|uniref:hypothetical protein n=1 Tax=Desulfosporosinus sp. BG TaxID=1633135 RepID=UPI00083B6BE6|nr:hypothetical protein [Desulfosporosinus sp. BG]ODA43023.1 hypothetical protein DSBG_0019 [Desulfosporosinus sp. BG]